MAVECFFIQCQQSDISYFSSSDWSTLIFCLTIWSMCCNLSREYTPVKPKVSQKAEYQFVKWKPRFLVSSSPLVLFNLGQTGKSLSRRKGKVPTSQCTHESNHSYMPIVQASVSTSRAWIVEPWQWQTNI